MHRYRSYRLSPLGQWLPDADFVAVVQQLPKRQRTAAALHYLAGSSTSEIARTMGISEGTVGSHILVIDDETSTQMTAEASEETDRVGTEQFTISLKAGIEFAPAGTQRRMLPNRALTTGRR